MDHTYVDAKNLKTLEQYAVALISAFMSLKTLESFEAKAVDLGILTEDLSCRANTIVWDLRRLMAIYLAQAETTLQLINPEEMDVQKIINDLQKSALTKARQITRKKREK